MSANQVLGACVLTVYGDDASVEVDYPEGDDNLVEQCEAIAKQKANDYDPDSREFGGAHDSFFVVTFDEGGKFDFNEVAPDEGKGYNSQV